MRILVTNDDGILAPGLWALVRELVPFGEVWVVAPDREQSGIGTALTLLQPLRVHEFTYAPVPDVHAYAVQGTPSDCVVLALEHLVPDAECVFSGINAGANLGDDALLSGTVAAAFHGYFRGLPSFAISLMGIRAPQFEASARLGGLLAQLVAQGQLREPFVLSINLPNIPWEELRGIEITHLARRTYRDEVVETRDAWGRPQYWLRRGTPKWEEEEGTDVWAVRQQRVSITPLHSNLTVLEVTPGLLQAREVLGQHLTPPELLPPFDPNWVRRAGRIMGVGTEEAAHPDEVALGDAGSSEP